MVPATGSNPLIQGRDYDGRLTITNGPYRVEKKTDHLQNRYDAEFLSKELKTKINAGDLIVHSTVRVDQTKDKIQKLNPGIHFFTFRLEDLIHGKEEKVITIWQGEDKLRFLCKQNYGSPSDENFEDAIKSFQDLNYYDSERNIEKTERFNFQLYTHKLKSIPQITRMKLIAVTKPDLKESCSLRQEALFKLLQKEREEGRTGFLLRVKETDKTSDIYAHRCVLDSYSDFFAKMGSTLMTKGKTASDHATIYELNAPIYLIKLLINYLYTGTIELDNPIDDSLDLLKLHGFLQLNEGCSHLYNYCLNSIKNHVSKKTLWKVIAFATLLNRQELLDISEEFLKEKKLNLLDITFSAVILLFMQENKENKTSLIPFFCDQFRSRLQKTKDAELWYDLHQFSQENKEHYLAIEELNQVCVKLALKSPAILEKYIEMNSIEALSLLNDDELKEKEVEANAIICGKVTFNVAALQSQRYSQQENE